MYTHAVTALLLAASLAAFAQEPSTAPVVTDQAALEQARRELEENRLKARELEERIRDIEARIAEKAKTAACPAELGSEAGLIRHAIGERWKDGVLPAPADLARWRCGCLEADGEFKPAVLAGKVQFGELARVVVLPLSSWDARGGVRAEDAEALKRCLLGKDCPGQSFEKPRAVKHDGLLFLGGAARQEWRLRRSEDAVVLSAPSPASFGVSFGFFPARFCGP